MSSKCTSPIYRIPTVASSGCANVDPIIAAVAANLGNDSTPDRSLVSGAVVAGILNLTMSDGVVIAIPLPATVADQNVTDTSGVAGLAGATITIQAYLDALATCLTVKSTLTYVVPAAAGDSQVIDITALPGYDGETLDQLIDIRLVAADGQDQVFVLHPKTVPAGTSLTLDLSASTGAGGQTVQLTFLKPKF